MRYPGLLLAACALLASYHYLTTRPLHWRPGALVSTEPQQVEIEGTKPFTLNGFRLTPRARFTAEVRVLSRADYWLGTLAKVSPIDIAVGWGPMSDSAVLKELDISQSGRFFYWQYDHNPPPVPRKVIETHASNWHLVPDGAATRRKLKNLRVGDVVTLSGLLVDIETPEKGTIRTSLRRDDTGAGACEVIFVETASLRYR